MNIALFYAMRGEIASMLHGDDTPLLQTVAGVEFYRIRPNVIACCGGVGKVSELSKMLAAIQNIINAIISLTF